MEEDAGQAVGLGASRASPGAVPPQAALSVAEVLDRLKAAHPDGTLGPAEAEMLMMLAEGVIRGSRLRNRSRWAAVLGPVVTSGVAAKLLRVSTTTLDQRRNSAAVLGVRTESGRWVYPLAQFQVDARGNIEVRPGVRDVLTKLHAATDGLAAARWLATPNRRLAGDTPWETLASEGRHEDVAAAAAAQGSMWAGR